MADLDPIKQVVQIDVKEKGVSEASKDFDNLQTSITETTTANTKGNSELKKTEEGFKTLKVQLREAIALQQKMSAQYGSTSAEAIKATKAVAGIKDEIGFQKDLVASYNPDEKFRKLTQTAGVAALALGGVKDGFSALGIESKTLDKIIGSAQAILGVTSAVAGLSDAYAILTVSKKAKSAADVVEAGTTEALVVVEGEATVATTGATIATTAQAAATWALNAAIAVLTSPILLVVAAIALLVGGIGYLTGAFGDFSGEAELAKRAAKSLSKEIDKQSEAFEKNSKKTEENNGFKLKMLKASGASEEAIYKETKALKEQELQLARNNEAQALFNLKKAIFANQADPNDLNNENQKKAQEAFTKAKENVVKTADAIRAIKQDYLVAERQAETDARKKAEEAAEKARQSQKEKARLAKEKKLEDLKKFNEDVLNEQKSMNVRGVEQEIQDKLDEQERKDASAQEAFEAGDRAQQELDKQKENDKKSDQALVDQKAKNKENDKKSDQALVEQKQKNAEDILATGDALIEGAKLLAGKNKSIQKAAIITEGAVSLGKVGVNIATGVSKDASTGAVASIPQIAKTLATGAFSVASIISNTSRALKAVGGGGGISDGGGNSLPTRNVAQVGFQGSSENQISSAISQQQKNQPPIQAFVVSQSLTDQQELDRKKELANSF